MNIAAKFSFIQLTASEEMMFFIFFRKFSFSVAMTINQIQGFGRKLYLVEDYSVKISENLLPKYLQRNSNKCQFSISHCKSMETLSCDSKYMSNSNKKTLFS